MVIHCISFQWVALNHLLGSTCLLEIMMLFINSLSPSKAIWCQKCGSKLVQVMAWWLMQKVEIHWQWRQELVYFTISDTTGSFLDSSWPCFNIMTIFPCICIPIIKIIWWWDHLFFVTGIFIWIGCLSPALVGWHVLISFGLSIRTKGPSSRLPYHR